MPTWYTANIKYIKSKGGSMKNLNDIKKEIHEENKRTEKIEADMKKEIKGYAKDAMAKNVELFDDKPLLQKIIFFLAGFTNFIVGFALYFLLRDNNKTKWQSSYLVKGSMCGVILSFTIATAELISFIANKISG